MNPSLVFSVANTVTLLAWVALALLPRWPGLRATLQWGLISALSITYVTLVSLYFFDVQGGGFASIAEVRTLFQSDPMLVAGWIHYLAFDLFVGLYIAQEADAMHMPRVLQAIVLCATFLFGPLGLLLFSGCKGAVLTNRRFFQSRAY